MVLGFQLVFLPETPIFFFHETKPFLHSIFAVLIFDSVRKNENVKYARKSKSVPSQTSLRM